MALKGVKILLLVCKLSIEFLLSVTFVSVYKPTFFQKTQNNPQARFY